MGSTSFNLTVWIIEATIAQLSASPSNQPSDASSRRLRPTMVR
jgi:hypothetical protein